MATTFRDPAERSRYLRLFYRGWRPTRLGRLASGAWAWLSVAALKTAKALGLTISSSLLQRADQVIE
jgi:hypothetical protein